MLFALHPTACQTRASGFCGRDVRVRGENYLLGLVSPVANLGQLLQRDTEDRAACGRSICPISSKDALNRALQVLMVA